MQWIREGSLRGKRRSLGKRNLASEGERMYVRSWHVVEGVQRK
jgi:hypothetical protein